APDTVATSASMIRTGPGGPPARTTQSSGPASTSVFSVGSNPPGAMPPSPLGFQLGQPLLDLGVRGDPAAVLGPHVDVLALAEGAAGGELADRPQLVDEQDAVQVVVLVLQDARGQVAGLQLDQLALEVVGLHAHRLGPADLLVQLREAQAALLALDRPLL